MLSTGMSRSATTASAAARNAAATSSPPDTGYASGRFLPVDGSTAVNEPAGFAACRHSPAMRTGSSAIAPPCLLVYFVLLGHFVLQRQLADGDADDVARRQRKLLGRDDAGAGEQERAGREH